MVFASCGVFHKGTCSFQTPSGVSPLVFNGLLYGGDMAPDVKQDTAAAFPAELRRVERIDWGMDYGRSNHRLLGELRRLLRELAEWPDDALIETAGISAFRVLPLHTEDET